MWIQDGAALGSRPLKLNKEGCGATVTGTVGKDSWQNRGGKRTKTGKKKQLSSEVWAPALWGGASSLAHTCVQA